MTKDKKKALIDKITNTSIMVGMSSGKAAIDQAKILRLLADELIRGLEEGVK